MEPIKREYIERHETAKAMISAMKGVISPYDVVAVAEVLRNQPAADVVEVVRCKECVYRQESHYDDGTKKVYINCRWSVFANTEDGFCVHGDRGSKND